MTAKQRLDNFLAGEPVDRRPNLTIVGSFVTRYTGISMETFCQDYKAMVDAALRCTEDGACDYIQISSDLHREAEGFGAEVRFTQDAPPTVVKPAADSIEAAARLTPLKPEDVPRLTDLIRAAEYVTPLAGKCSASFLLVGPMTVAGSVRGVEDFFLDVADEPEAVGALLDIVTETTLDLARALMDAGAVYFNMADPVASLVRPDYYAEAVLPRHRRVFEYIKSRGGHARLHMCGNTLRILPHSVLSGAEVIDIDHSTDFNEALDIAEGHCVLAGNIDPVADVFQATPEHVAEAIRACAKVAGTRRALFMPGCELPGATARENVLAIPRTLAELGPV